MSNRFHSKWHRHNHHSTAIGGEPDSSHDPIASQTDPFQGDFVLQGALSAYAPASACAGIFQSNYAGVCAIGGTMGIYASSVSHDNGNILISAFGSAVIFPDISNPAIFANGSLVVTNAISANSLWVTQLYSASSVVDVTDMSITELSGFMVRGSDYSLDVPATLDPLTHQAVTLEGIGISGTSWASIEGDMQAGRDMYAYGKILTDNISAVTPGTSAIDIWNNINLQGYSITGNNIVLNGSITANAFLPVMGTVIDNTTLVATDATAGGIFRITLTESVTLSNPTGAADGQTLTWLIKQGGSGSNAVTLDTKFIIPTSATVPLAWSIIVGYTDILAVRYSAADDKFLVLSMVPGYIL